MNKKQQIDTDEYDAHLRDHKDEHIQLLEDMVIEQEGVIEAQRAEIAEQLKFNHYLSPVISVYAKAKEFLFALNTPGAQSATQDLYQSFLAFIEPT